MFGDIIKRITRYLNPTVIFPRLKSLMSAWNSADAKNRAILAVVFAPTFLCIGGVLFTIVSFVLFVLPSFVIRLISWIIMSAVFGAGGTYLYERLTGQKMKKEAFFSSSFTFSRSESTADGNVHQSSGGSFYDIGWKNVEEPDDRRSDPAASGDDDKESVRKKWYESLRNSSGR